jgi:hypothetical protein
MNYLTFKATEVHDVQMLSRDALVAVFMRFGSRWRHKLCKRWRHYAQSTKVGCALPFRVHVLTKCWLSDIHITLACRHISAVGNPDFHSVDATIFFFAYSSVYKLGSAQLVK